MLDCRRCKNWVDETFDQLIEESRNGHASESIFYGCKIFGMLESHHLENCDYYQQAAELFGVCSRCGIAAPRVCLSLGECINCTDTDLYCVENCHGEGEKKFCSHFQRLVRDGHTLIENNQCFELYPTQEGPAKNEPSVTPVVSLFPNTTKPN